MVLPCRILSYQRVRAYLLRSSGKTGLLASHLSRSLKVIGTDTDRSATYDFLLMVRRDVNRGQMLEAKAESEAKVKKAEQNTIFHNENICRRNTVRSCYQIRFPDRQLWADHWRQLRVCEAADSIDSGDGRRRLNSLAAEAVLLGLLLRQIDTKKTRRWCYQKV